MQNDGEIVEIVNFSPVVQRPVIVELNECDWVGLVIFHLALATAGGQ